MSSSLLESETVDEVLLVGEFQHRVQVGVSEIREHGGGLLIMHIRRSEIKSFRYSLGGYDPPLASSNTIQHNTTAKILLAVPYSNLQQCSLQQCSCNRMFPTAIF